MANRRVLVAARGPLTHGSVTWKAKPKKVMSSKNVKFFGPSVLRSDEGFTLIASGNGKVHYGVPSFIK
jgi:hypothetical protein